MIAGLSGFHKPSIMCLNAGLRRIKEFWHQKKACRIFFIPNAFILVIQLDATVFIGATHKDCLSCSLQLFLRCCFFLVCRNVFRKASGSCRSNSAPPIRRLAPHSTLSTSQQYPTLYPLTLAYQFFQHRFEHSTP